jgi:hypothetical protein
MDRNDVEAWARDAAYTAVGFCVLGFQQLQIRRRELTSDLGERMGTTSGRPAGRSSLEQIVRQAEAVVDPVLDGVERVLPATARTAVHQSRTAAKVLRKVLL